MPDARANEDGPVLRGTVADAATAASFGVDLRHNAPVDSAPVERAKQQARTAGYAEGWAQGRRAAATEAEVVTERARVVQQADEQHRVVALARAVDAVGRAVSDLETRTAPTLEELREAVLAHAFELAEAIVGRTVDNPDGRGADALRRAMAAVTDHGETVVVSLHPDDFRSLAGAGAEAEHDYQGRKVRLRPDPALRPGDAMADTGSTTVDASIATAVARAKEALRL